MGADPLSPCYRKETGTSAQCQWDEARRAGHKERVGASLQETNSRVFITPHEIDLLPVMSSALFLLTALRMSWDGSYFSHHRHSPLLSHTQTNLLFLGCSWVLDACWSLIFFFLSRKKELHCLSKKKKELGREKNHTHLKGSTDFVNRFVSKSLYFNPIKTFEQPE